LTKKGKGEGGKGKGERVKKLEEDCDLSQLKTSFSEGALNPFGERGKQKDTCIKKSALHNCGMIYLTQRRRDAERIRS